MPSVGEGSVKHLRHEQCRAQFADTGKRLEDCDFLVLGKRRRRIDERRHALGLKRLHLLSDQHESHELARYLGFEILVKRPPVAGSQHLELFAPGAAEEPLDPADAVQREERADSIHVARPLADEPRPLAADALSISGFGRRDRHRSEYALVAVEVRAQLKGHRLDVDAISLRPATSARHQEARRVEDEDVNALVLQEPRKPKTVIAALVADLEVNPPCMLALQPSLGPSKQAEQTSRITPP